MAIFTKDSLETLRGRIDLIQVISSHVELKKSGASYKGLCPFHDEKTPSFMVQKGDTHYHCFGCGAHGDAIQFLMTHVKISFVDAVKSLAQQFHVHLEEAEDSKEHQGVNKAALKEALQQACRFYHFMLLHTEEGQQALSYLYSRGFGLDFIRRFQIGWAPKGGGILRKILHSLRIQDQTMVEAGLLSINSAGSYRDFFAERIMIPIHDPQGMVIGFSGRKCRSDTYGGKYVNTSETALFKKSRVLFGLNYCRKRIIKERQAIIVEGQLDALRLIGAGFNITVAGQGTAFGEGHVKELIQLGVRCVNIATDSDDAGKEAACKIGNLFQREGIDVFVLSLPQGSDPDSYLCHCGPQAFLELIEQAPSYLEFLVNHRSLAVNMNSPAGKTELVQTIAQQIRSWNNPLMVHESLRQLAHLAHVPESMIEADHTHGPNIYIKRSSQVDFCDVDPDRILEFDFLRWLLLLGQSYPHFFELAKGNVQTDDFKVKVCSQIYQTFLEHISANVSCDWLLLASQLDDQEGQQAVAEILSKKINRERAEEQFKETIQRLLDRKWMEAREAIKVKIQSGHCSDEEAMDLVKQFDDLKRSPPKIAIPTGS